MLNDLANLKAKALSCRCKGGVANKSSSCAFNTRTSGTCFEELLVVQHGYSFSVEFSVFIEVDAISRTQSYKSEYACREKEGSFQGREVA